MAELGATLGLADVDELDDGPATVGAGVEHAAKTTAASTMVQHFIRSPSIVRVILPSLTVRRGGM
jgi:hypothetical protein